MFKKQKISIQFVLVFLLVSCWVTASEPGNKPVAVSPGSETEVAEVWQSCPTFSWSAVDQAASYRIAVFEAADPKLTSYEEMTAISSPVVIKDIPGPALSWTISSDLSLKTGGMYVWYVQALDASGNALGPWSSGRLFKVEQEIRFAGIEEKLAEKLRAYGVNEETITNVLTDMKSEVKEVVVQAPGDKNTPDISRVQGYEGASNTYYGLTAGASMTTGYSNSFFGQSAGNRNTTGNWNTFLGNGAGYFNNTGNANTFLGFYAGNSNTTASYNTFIGFNAGWCNTIGYENTFIGFNAGNANTTGRRNTYFGCDTGVYNTTGEGHVFLGFNAGKNETGSNKLYISNSDTSFPLIYGAFDSKIVTINGKLGIGTKTPAYPMELDTTGLDAALVLKRTSGVTNSMSATASYAQFGSITNHPVLLLVNNRWRLKLNTNGSLSMASGATCTIGGVWTNASSRSLKENIQALSTGEAMDALNKLIPVKYNYKVDKSDKHVGFIAEDVPDLVATADRKGLSPMDVTAVLTKVVQEQQNTISILQERISKLENKR